MDTNKILSGAVAGLIAAVAIDLHAWQADGYDFSFAKTFNWKLAATRWVTGLISGALAGAGFGHFNPSA